MAKSQLSLNENYSPFRFYIVLFVKITHKNDDKYSTTFDIGISDVPNPFFLFKIKKKGQLTQKTKNINLKTSLQTIIYSLQLTTMRFLLKNTVIHIFFYVCQNLLLIVLPSLILIVLPLFDQVVLRFKFFVLWTHVIFFINFWMRGRWLRCVGSPVQNIRTIFRHNFILVIEI